MIQRIKEFIGGLLARSDLDALDPHEVNEIARDMGVTADDLYRLDRVSSHTTLMPKRLSLEGVDPAIVQAEWPSVWKDLQRACSLCGSKDVCRNELVLAPEAADWRLYCRNESTIKAFADDMGGMA